MLSNGAKRTLAALTAIAALKFSGQAAAQEAPETSHILKTAGESSFFCTNDGHLAKLKGVSVTKIDYSELVATIAQLQLNNPDKEINALANIELAPLPPYNWLARALQDYSSEDLTTYPLPPSAQDSYKHLRNIWKQTVASQPQPLVKQEAITWNVQTLVSDKQHRRCGNVGTITEAVMRNEGEQQFPFQAPKIHHF